MATRLFLGISLTSLFGCISAFWEGNSWQPLHYRAYWLGEKPNQIIRHYRNDRHNSLKVWLEQQANVKVLYEHDDLLLHYTENCRSCEFYHTPQKIKPFYVVAYFDSNRNIGVRLLEPFREQQVAETKFQNLHATAKVLCCWEEYQENYESGDDPDFVYYHCMSTLKKSGPEHLCTEIAELASKLDKWQLYAMAFLDYVMVYHTGECVRWIDCRNEELARSAWEHLPGSHTKAIIHRNNRVLKKNVGSVEHIEDCIWTIRTLMQTFPRGSWVKTAYNAQSWVGFGDNHHTLRVQFGKGHREFNHCRRQFNYQKSYSNVNGYLEES